MADSFELYDEVERLKIDLEDDVRAFLMRRLAWNRMPDEQREELRLVGADVKRLRRPSYIDVSSEDEEAPPEIKRARCNVGAEGVMTHVDEYVVHLAFKCGNPRHSYHYSTFDPRTIIALAKACEAAWPGSITQNVGPQDEAPLVLNPGEDDDDEIDPDEIDPDEDEDEDEEADDISF